MSDDPKRRPLSFSQAQGFEPLPTPLALGQLSDHARIDLWNWLWSWMRTGVMPGDGTFFGPMDVLYRTLHASFFHRPLDEYTSDAELHAQRMKKFFAEAPFNQVFDLIQFMLRTPFGLRHLESVQFLFRRNLLAYDLLDISPYGPTIVPNASPEEGQAIQAAFAVLASGPFDGARLHLKQAADFINAGNWPKAVAESMHSVESVVRVISPNTNFAQALNALNVKSAMHPAFRDALSKLYGYTSGEKGIRHPLLESDVSRVQMPEATFMYGACASFITYLIARARETGLLDR